MTRYILLHVAVQLCLIKSVFEMVIKGLQEQREFSHGLRVMLLQLHISNCADFHVIHVVIYL